MALNTRARQPHCTAMPSPLRAHRAARRAWPAGRLLGLLALLAFCAAPAALAQQTTSTTPVTLTPVRKGATAAPATSAPQEGPAATLKPVVKGSKPAPTPTPAAEKPAAKPATPALQSDAIGGSDKAAEALPRSPKTAEPARERATRRRSESATATAAAKASKAAKATPAAEEQLAALLAGDGNEENRAKLRQFVIEHRETPLAARALLGIADLSLKMNDRMEARLAYDSVRRLKQATPAQIASAEAGLAQLSASEGQPAATTAAAPPAPAAPAPVPAPASPDPQVLAQQREQATAMVTSTIDQAYQKTVADPAAADDAWKQADTLLTEPPGPLDGNTATRLQARLLLGQGLSAELARRDGDARRLYQRLVELLPASREAELARARLGDLDAPLAP